MIEHAKSNRSYCCASRKPIPCGALRLAPPPFHTGMEHHRGRSDATTEIVKGHIKALVDERAAAGIEPVHSPYTKPCWERRALMALMTNDKPALKAALEEEDADVTTKVDEPRLGGSQGRYHRRGPYTVRPRP